ncbi:MAG TPA: ATP-binding protein [Thermoanaerobaculia bacterium]|nr:ATP-binding protein [Thermoanaerobaculia bacterium]
MLKRSANGKLSSAQRQLRALQGEVAHLSQPGRFAQDLEELQVQLAELDVAYEELEQQNDELQATREALERERHRYRHLFDEAPFGYLVTDVHGVIEEANHTAATLIGVHQDLLTGKPLFLYLGDRRLFRGLIPRACAGEAVGEVEVSIRPRNGEPFAAMLTVIRDLDDRARARRLRWSVLDISRTRAAEEALRTTEEQLRHAQRMEAVGRLAGGIAHSFNNLLAAIAFQCELLCEEIDEGDKRRTHVEEIQRAQERAATLARQLLAFSRKQVLQPRKLLLDGVIRDMEPMLRRLIGEHIRLETRLGTADGTVHADLGQLEQVILNLVVNARDAMPDGGTLRLATKEVEVTEPGEAGGELPPGRYLQLSVTDTGIGMPPEVKERLFEPFFTTKERGQGTGLGLATVHGIVHQSGGDIQVESEAGQGSRFTVLLPQAAESEEAPWTPPPAQRRRRSRGSEVVLLVEDEDNIREPAVEILESRGYQVLAAQDAAQAFEIAERHPGPIHILVTDVVMPGLSGGQLAQQLVRRRPGLRVLYISGYPEDSISHHGVLQPEQHFLQKPFPPGQFLEKVREVLDMPAGTAA